MNLSKELSSLITKDDFETKFKDLYLTQLLSLTKIGQELNICSDSVKKIIQYYNLTRDNNKVKSKSQNKNNSKQKQYNNIKNIITKEDLYQWYIIEDHEYKDAPKHFNISQWQFDKLCKEYQIKKDRRKTSKKGLETKYIDYGSKENYNNYINQKRLETIKNNYGSIDNYKNYISNKSKLAWSKLNKEDRLNLSKKIISSGGGWNKNTINKTIINKYKVTNISQLDSIKRTKAKSLKITSQNKWGVDHPFQAKENKEKAKEVIKARYGVDSITKSPLIQERIRKTNLQKYKRTYGFNFEKCKQTSLEKYGVPYNCLLPQCYNAIGSKGKDTKPNLNFSSILDNNNIKYEREFRLNNNRFDFKIENTLIEINPSATHNSSWGLFNKEGINKNYHKLKTELAKTNGYRCIHVFDWDDINKIIYQLQSKEVIYARNCSIKLIENKEVVDTFLNLYHLQNTCTKQLICIGLYYKDILVELMTFGKPRYNKKYEWELLRLCSHKDFKIVGGSQKLFKYFINNYNPKSIISYCDLSKFTGDIYSKLGFKLKKINNPSCHWYNIKTNQHITDNLLRQLGFDKLLGKYFENYGKGSSNEELMLTHNFVKIYDCGQATYIYSNI